MSIISFISTEMIRFSKNVVTRLIGFAFLLQIIHLVLSQSDKTEFGYQRGVIASNVKNVAQKWNWTFVQEMEQKHQQQFQSYFVHTKGCKMPSFPVIDKNIEQFITNVEHVSCGIPLTRSNDTCLWINLNENEIKSQYGVNQIEDIHCQYNSVHRLTDFRNEYGKLVYTFKFGEIVKVNDEFISVTCKLDSTGKEIYKDYHFFVPDKISTDDQSNSNDSQHTDKQTANKPMNVMVLGIDAVSRLNFHRQMTKTANVLVNDLKAVELFGFNKVGDNTYPNLIPTLTGLDENELNTSCISSEDHTFDNCNFIWKAFKERNFTTLFAEDVASLGLFHYFRAGFKNQSTDFCLRPIFKEMEKYIANQRDGNAFLCMGKRRTFDILMEYVQKFIDAMDDRLYFSFFWSASYTHDYFNYPKHIDTDLADFLRQMQSTNKLDNTFLIVMSDHGIRWGSFRNTYQGMMEERQPFVFFVPPKRFPQQYPEAMRNLVKNRHALTTHFDLYETLHDLTNLESIESERIIERTKRLQETEPMPRGISLFQAVPESRSCAKAEIASHWCTCNERIELNQTDPRITKAARIVINHLNDLLKPYPQCHPLELNNLFGGSLGASNTDIRSGKNYFVDITVRLQTKPGLGEFEATVRIHNRNRYELTGKVSRTNLYGKQSHCIDDYNLKLYCYCNDQI